MVIFDFSLVSYRLMVWQDIEDGTSFEPKNSKLEGGQTGTELIHMPIGYSNHGHGVTELRVSR
jgi:hypothetical protein